MFYTPAAEGCRAFFKDVLELPCKDAGEGWLIFETAESEVGFHPDEGIRHEISFYCDDIESEVAALKEKGVEFTGPVKDHAKRARSTALDDPAAGAPAQIAKIRTTGSTIPSLRPLSTFNAWRIRTGTIRLETTDWPSAASVGASMAARRNAVAHDIAGNKTIAATPPNRMINGNPTINMRCGKL